MRKDIEIPEVKDIAIAIVPEKSGEGEREWSVYFLNLKEYAVDAVLINASANGRVNGEERHTATLRFFLDRIEGRSVKKFESILPDTFALNNHYWVSFYEGRQIFDKKYVFAANTVNEDRLVMVPILNKAGSMVV
jgi:hypothetical protein